MSSETLPRARIVALLGEALGDARASELVTEVSRLLGFGDTLTPQQAFSVLDALAERRGIESVAASFTKSRLHLVWDRFAD